MTERFRKTATQAGQGIFGQDILSASIGNASYPSDGDSAEDLLTQADHEMYAMKASSRTKRANGFVLENGMST